MSRLVLFMLVITMPVSSAACAFGCNDDRSPSNIWIELAEPLPEGSYDVMVCVDDNCDEFIDIGERGTGGTAEASIEIRSDVILVTPWSRQIEPGEHRVDALVSSGDDVLLRFDGVAEFESNGRCYEDDSTTTIDAESLTTP